MAIKREKSQIAIARNPIVTARIKPVNYGDLGSAGLANVGNAAFRIAEVNAKETADDYIQEHKFDGLKAPIDPETGAVSTVKTPDDLGTYATNRLQPRYDQQAISVGAQEASARMRKEASKFPLDPDGLQASLESMTAAQLAKTSSDVSPALEQELKSISSQLVARTTNRVMNRKLAEQDRLRRKAERKAEGASDRRWVAEHANDGLNVVINQKGGVQAVNVPDHLGDAAYNVLQPRYQKQAVDVAVEHARSWMVDASAQYATDPAKLKEILNGYIEGVVETSSPGIVPLLEHELNKVASGFVKGTTTRLTNARARTDAHLAADNITTIGNAVTNAFMEDESQAAEPLANLRNAWEYGKSIGVVSGKESFDTFSQSFIGMGQVQKIVNDAMEDNTIGISEIDSLLNISVGIGDDKEVLGLNTQVIADMIPNRRMRDQLRTKLRMVKTKIAADNALKAEQAKLDVVTNTISSGGMFPVGTEKAMQTAAIHRGFKDKGYPPIELYSKDGLLKTITEFPKAIPYHVFNRRMNNPQSRTLAEIEEAMAIFTVAKQHKISSNEQFLNADDQSFYTSLMRATGGGGTNLEFAFNNLVEQRNSRADALSKEQNKVFGVVAATFTKSGAQQVWTDIKAEAGITQPLLPRHSKAIAGYLGESYKSATDYNDLMEIVGERFNREWPKIPTIPHRVPMRMVPGTVSSISDGLPTQSRDYIFQDSAKIIASAAPNQRRIPGFDKTKATFRTENNPEGTLMLVPIETNDPVQMYEVYADPNIQNEAVMRIARKQRAAAQAGTEYVLTKKEEEIRAEAGKDLGLYAQPQPVMDENNNVVRVSTDRARQLHQDNADKQNKLIAEDKADYDELRNVSPDLLPGDRAFDSPNTQKFNYTEYMTKAETKPEDYRTIRKGNPNAKPPKVTWVQKLNPTDLNTNSDGFVEKANFFEKNPVKDFDQRYGDLPKGLYHFNPLGLPYDEAARQSNGTESKTDTSGADTKMAHFKHLVDGAAHAARFVKNQFVQQSGFNKGANLEPSIHEIVGKWMGDTNGPPRVARIAVALGKLLKKDPSTKMKTMSDDQLVKLLHGMTVIKNNYSIIHMDTWRRAILK